MAEIQYLISKAHGNKIKMPPDKTYTTNNYLTSTTKQIGPLDKKNYITN